MSLLPLSLNTTAKESYSGQPVSDTLLASIFETAWSRMARQALATAPGIRSYASEIVPEIPKWTTEVPAYTSTGA
jgi:hypothetical protein